VKVNGALAASQLPVSNGSPWSKSQDFRGGTLAFKKALKPRTLLFDFAAQSEPLRKTQGSGQPWRAAAFGGKADMPT
jgi:hypothetical protein